MFPLVAASLFVSLVAVPGFLCALKWRERIRKLESRQKSTAMLKVRLLKNWSSLLSSGRVGELSHMPEEWKSGIVPVRSTIGQSLNAYLVQVGRQIEKVSTDSLWRCGNDERGERELKASMSNFMQQNVAGFFIARHQMYKSYLLQHPNVEHKDTKSSPTTAAKVLDPESPAAEEKSNGPGSEAKELASEGKASVSITIRDDEESKIHGPAFKASGLRKSKRTSKMGLAMVSKMKLMKRSLAMVTQMKQLKRRNISDRSKQNTTELSTSKRIKIIQELENKHKIPWPENTTPLFRQIMFLLRDLDDLFKASYNQRFYLRIMDNEFQEWSDWISTEFPKLMPSSVVLKQNTPCVFELYRQAAQLHSYYDHVFASIARATKAQWIPAPLKKIFRILEKADHQHVEDHTTFDCSRIFDVVRGTLVYDTLSGNDGGVLCGVRAVFASKKFQVVRLKDRFTYPTSACWRDVLLNGRMISGDGTVHPHLVEVQFHQRDLREERMNVGGHFIYERHRALFEACESACGNEAGDMLEEMHFISAREPIVNDLSNGRNSFIKKLASFGSPRRASS